MSFEMADNKRLIELLFDKNQLNSECQQWAFTHGFVQRYLSDYSNDYNVIPYPMTIYPSPYPHKEYHQAKQFQYGINRFIQRLANDIDLMDSVFENFIDCDPFIKRLREIYDKIQEISYKSSIETCIIRTDYMLQERNSLKQRTKLRLVEINTIAVGLGAAAKLIQQWHKKILTRIQPEVLSQLPENESSNLIIDTLYKSWQLYNNKNSIILFVISECEFNIGDQMLIEDGLCSYNESSLIVKHVTLIDIYHSCSVNSHGFLYFKQYEVGLVYYRTGYSPEHFPNEKIWQTYFMLESSRAIKCPSIKYHLAGMKCFQLELIKKQFLKHIFHEYEQEFIENIQEISEDMFTIDQVINDSILQQRIENQPDSFYLKQNREGGGNVYCGLQLKNMINKIIDNKQSNRYFLMSRIYSPSYRNLVRPSRMINSLKDEEINSELGIFGSLISDNGRIIFERIGGSLLRSKPVENIEGGIASGKGYIDSILLV